MADIVMNPQTGERRYWNGTTWAPLPNTKAAGYQYLTETFTPGDKSEAAAFREYKGKDNPAQSSAAVGIRNARRLEGLLARQQSQGQGTGGIYGIPLIGGVAGWMDPEIREMDSIQSEMARNKRQPGEGAISDFDAQQFLAMSPGRDKPLKTNEAIIRAQRLADDAVQQRRQFLEWYQGTYGNTNGSTELWSRYADDNPIFSPESEQAGSPTLNGNRQNWRAWLGIERGPGDARDSQVVVDTKRAAGAGGGTRAPKKPLGWSKSLSPEVQAQLGQYLGSKAAGGSADNPYAPTSEAEYNKIPSGARYLHPSGEVRVKK